MPEKIRTYRDLDIWKAGIKLVKDIYQLTEQFPKQEVYGLVSQMRRAGVPYLRMWLRASGGITIRSIGSFCIALGSCAELETQIEIAVEL